MKKTTRRILALVLSLALVCTIATTIFAAATEYEISAESGSVWCYDVYFHTFVQGDGTRARAEMVVDQVGTYTYNATVTLDYTYCPDDQMRPSAYLSGTVSHSFSRYSGLKYTNHTLSGSYTMIDATGHTAVSQTVNQTKYTTDGAYATIYINR